MHAWVEVGIHTYIYGRARVPRHDLVSCFQILHFRVHSWPTAKSHTQPLFSFSLLRDVEIYDDCPPIVLKEMSRFTLIALQSWSVYTNCRLFTHANSASKASVQFSALRSRELQLKICPNIWFNYMYWEGHLKSKTVSEPCATHCIACLFYSGQKETYFFRRSTLFPLLRDNYYFFSECFFQNYDQNHFFVKDRKKRTSSTQGEIKNAVKRSRADTSLASHPWKTRIV